MTASPPRGTSRRTACAVAIAAALFTLVTGCSAGTGGHGPAASSVSAPVSATAAVRAVLRFDGHTVGITLTDTAASRDLAARLPLACTSAKRGDRRRPGDWRTS